jgi:hypothetical protein
MPFLRPALLALVVSSALAGPAPAAERCYLLVFGSQSQPAFVRYTHTYGTFVRACGDGPDPSAWLLEEVTISWLPRSLVLHPLSPISQEGVNLGLHDTLRYALDNRECITLWGPYEICPELFYKAVRRKAYLEAGKPDYNVVDRIRRPVVLDCIHALSGVDHDPGRFHTRTAYGEIASYFVLHHFGRWIIQPETTHDWLLERLCLGGYPIQRRGYCEEPPSILPILPPNYTQRQAPLIRPRFRMRAGLEPD